MLNAHRVLYGSVSCNHGTASRSGQACAAGAVHGQHRQQAAKRSCHSLRVFASKSAEDESHKANPKAERLYRILSQPQVAGAEHGEVRLVL